MQHEVFSDMLT